MEVTKREILFSIIIASVLFVIGLFISDKINISLMNKYEQYNTALQIDSDENLFRYGMKTNVGNAFVFGDLKAVDTVTFEEISGQYSYVKKVKEKYTMHTRQVAHTTTDSKGHTHTYYTTEVYYTWDYVGKEEKHCKNISFLNVKFDYGQIQFPDSSYITTKYEFSDTRYIYSGTGTEFSGTLYGTLKDNSIYNSKFYDSKTISETIEFLETGWELIDFWVIWIFFIIGVIVVFYYIDNEWLDG